MASLKLLEFLQSAMNSRSCLSIVLTHRGTGVEWQYEVCLRSTQVKLGNKKLGGGYHISGLVNVYIRETVSLSEIYHWFLLFGAGFIENLMMHIQ